jgi:hypothetical protein
MTETLTEEQIRTIWPQAKGLEPRAAVSDDDDDDTTDVTDATDSADTTDATDTDDDGDDA